jgi:hypothetical protein
MGVKVTGFDKGGIMHLGGIKLPCLIKAVGILQLQLRGKALSQNLGFKVE